MDRIFKVDIKIVFMIFVILDIFCVSLGMGVPFFCILFGLPVGWYSAKRIIVNSNREKVNFILKKNTTLCTCHFHFYFPCNDNIVGKDYSYVL